MKQLLRALLVMGCGSLLLGSDCMFGRPIVDERGRYYPSDGVISCSGTRCSDLPVYEFSLAPALESSPCAADLPETELEEALRAGPVLSGMRLTLSADRPRDLNLGALELQDACLVVSGPVRLTLGAGSRLTRVELRLGPAVIEAPEQSAKPAGRTTPDVYLSRAELAQVSLTASAENEASGSVQLEFSSCTQCATQLDSLDLIESQAHSSRLAADSLTVVGGALDTVELAFEYGLLAGVLGKDVRTTACNALSLVGATIGGRASKIGPCDCGREGSAEAADAGAPRDAGPVDAADSGPTDAGLLPPADATPPVAAPFDVGLPTPGKPDAGTASATGPTANQADAALVDAGAVDAVAVDAGATDASTAPEAGASETADAAVPSTSRADAGAIGATCLGATISQSTFFGGMVDGEVRAENSTFRSVLFARHAQTSLDMWSTQIELSAMCGNAISIRLDRTSGIGCSSCDAEVTARACRLDRQPEFTVNKCPAFRGSLEQCEAPLPTRMTPPVPRPPKLGS